MDRTSALDQPRSFVDLRVGSIDFLRENLKEITDTLGSAKKLDIYTMGRVPQDM